MTEIQLRRQVRYLTAFAIVSSVVMIVLVLSAFRSGPTYHFEELSVERLNVVEADGRYALVLANQDHLPGPILNGREIDRRQGMAGMLFFNDMGDEAGGLIVGNRETDDGRRYDLHLSFDGYGDDQVLALTHSEDGTSTGTRVRFIERTAPFTFAKLADMAWQTRNGTPEEQAQAREWLESNADKYSDGVAERIVLGSVDRVAAIDLMDPQGNARIRLSVDSLGVPALQFLDEDGRVVRSWEE